LVSHTITSSIVGANGSITPLGATQVVDGNSQTFTVTPTAGYHISDIKIDSVSLTGALADTYTFTNVKADHTIVITFAANDICLWDGGGADDNWSTAANWSNDTLPSISCDVVFDSTSSKNSVINASFANHIRSFTVNIGYLGTIFADTNLADDGNFNLNAGTFFASNSTISIGGSLSLSASSAATFNKGTSTINFDPTTAGKTIRTSGQQLGNLIFNGIDTIPAGMIIGTSQASTTGLIGNHTLKAGWTLQDSLSATALTAKTGALVDNGNAVTIAGNISIADKVGILASTGLWTQSASGNIANTAACNTFGSLTIAGAGVATTLTDGVRVGWGGGLGALTMGPGTLYGNSMSIVDYFSARVGGGVTVNNVIVGSKLAGFTLYPMGSASSQKAITLPNNFASTIQIQKQYYTVFTATGDFNFGNANLYINNDSDNLSTGSVDMGPYSLTCNNLTIGSTFGSAQFPSYYRIAGALKLGTGTINVGGNLTYGNALNFSNKLDLGSGTLNVVGNLDLNYITLVQGTSTVDLVGTGTISVTNSNNQSFYNLRCAHSGKTTRIISPAIRVLNILSTYSGGTLADKIVYLDKSDGDPFIDTGATLSNSTFLYVSSHSISVSGHNFAAVAYRSYYNDVVYTLTSNLSATNGVAIYSNTQDKAATLNAGTSNISTTNLRLGNAYDPNVLSYTGAIDFGSGNHVLTGTLMRDPLSTSTDFAINFNKSTVSIGGGADFSNITVTPGTSTVILNGAGGTTQTISGSATFNNLYASATSARAIRFAAGSTQTVLGTWTATGAPNQLLTLGLKAGDTGVWKINPTLWNVDYVNVSNSTNLASAKIDPTHSIDGGGNTNWFEGVIPRIIPTEPVSETISGTVAKIVSSTVQSIVGVATAVADVVKNTYEIVAQSIVGQAVVAVASAITNMLSKIGLTPEVASRVAAATAAIVTVVTAAIAPIAATGSLMNLGEIAHSIWQPIANLVTGKRRRNWGRVIEDGTGVPIPNTKINLVKVYRESPVVMYESQKVVASTYTDKNGKYGFIAEPGKYKLEIIKDNYEVVDTNSFLDFYHTNTLFEVKDYKQGLVIKDIAVSTGSENLLKMFKVTHLMQIIGKILAYASFGFLIFGTISIIPIIVGHLSLLNIGIMILYVFLWILNGKNLMKKSPWGVVVDKTKDTNLPLVLVRVIDKKTGQLVKTAVSNEKGRFSTFIDKGDYEIKALKAGYILDNPIHYAVGKEKTTLSKKIELRPI
jgi:RNase P/RNase MRP subunit p29